MTNDRVLSRCSARELTLDEAENVAGAAAGTLRSFNTSLGGQPDILIVGDNQQ